jgi:apolipoprotein N-acyltransferase
MFIENTLVTTVALRSDTTPATRWGGLLEVLFALAGLTACAVSLR